MKKSLLIFSFFILLICMKSYSWALPSCPISGYKHNCHGKYDFNDGNQYIGEWQNNKYNGKGSYFWSNGDKYVGEWKDGKKHGQGSYTFKDGENYIGQYINGKKYGQGTYTWANGDKYIGKYKNDKKNGLGTYTYGLNTKWSGYKYEGEYKNGKRYGQGTYTYKNGEKDVGEFQNSKLNGFAIRYDKYGTILKQGIWKDGKFLYAKKQTPTSTFNSKIEEYKRLCSEIGFTPGTEKFGDCVVEAMKKG